MFSGRLAVVTGGGSGIGRAVCKLLANENAVIGIADVNLDGAKETAQQIKNQDKHLPLKVDVSKHESVVEMFTDLKNKYNMVPSVVVNCAGITRDSLIINMTEENFDKVLNINLKGTFLTSQHACKLMIQEKVAQGTIVNVSSVSAKIGNVGQINYVASKSAVEGMTRTTAKEMARYNIRCNAVMPGFIETPIIKTIPPKVMEMVVNNIPMKRKGSPEEVAEAILFLASPKSSYITGTVLEVSGGL